MNWVSVGFIRLFLSYVLHYITVWCALSFGTNSYSTWMNFPLSHEFICSTSLLYLVLFQIHFPIYPFTINYLLHLFIIFYCIHSFLFPINCLLNFSIQLLKCSSFILGILVKKTRIWNTKNNKNVKFDEKRDMGQICAE